MKPREGRSLPRELTTKSISGLQIGQADRIGRGLDTFGRLCELRRKPSADSESDKRTEADEDSTPSAFCVNVNLDARQKPSGMTFDRLQIKFGVKIFAKGWFFTWKNRFVSLMCLSALRKQ